MQNVQNPWSMYKTIKGGGLYSPIDLTPTFGSGCSKKARYHMMQLHYASPLAHTRSGNIGCNRQTITIMLLTRAHSEVAEGDTCVTVRPSRPARCHRPLQSQVPAFNSPAENRQYE